KKPLYQYRLVVLPKDNVDLQIIRRALRRYNEKDQKMLDSLSFQFTDFQLNDSLWVDQNYFVDQMAFTSLKSLRKYQKKSQFFEIEDSLKVSLLFMKNFLDKGAQAPFSYVSQMITSIVLNKRKLDFLRQFDNEIIEDAIKNNKVEIYE
ncbi:MAG: peptidyl-prolyl cis-trans isomerase, partial [Flavobacteriaceae bacterium]